MKRKTDSNYFTDFVKDFQTVLKNINLETDNYGIYYVAFSHTSYGNEHHVENNERLEFLGDAILDFLLAEYLYLNYPNMPEGDLSKTRSKYVCAQANAEYSLMIGLDKCLLLGKGEEEQGGRTKTTVLADLFEAFLGAVYLDKGVDAVRNILDSVIFSKIEYIDTGYFVDYKSHLQECMQARSRKGLEYIVEAENGPAHQKSFIVSVYHEGIKLGSGRGKSKKEAEQAAAQEALTKLKI